MKWDFCSLPEMRFILSLLVVDVYFGKGGGRPGQLSLLQWVYCFRRHIIFFIANENTN